MGPDRRQVLAGGAALAAAGSGAGKAQIRGRGVDLALVLAADCSGSVRGEHYRLQQRGYAEAFRQREIVKAILAGPHGGIAVAFFQWSGFMLQQVSIPWAELRSTAAIADLADRLERLERVIFGGGTSPAGAIEHGAKLLAELPSAATRRVIDVSGDGRSNNGPAPAASRDAAVAQGITINGLPILHMEPEIDAYYRDNVIGGPGAFSLPARDYDSFGEAVRRKLILEIAAAG